MISLMVVSYEWIFLSTDSKKIDCKRDLSVEGKNTLCSVYRSFEFWNRCVKTVFGWREAFFRQNIENNQLRLVNMQFFVSLQNEEDSWNIFMLGKENLLIIFLSQWGVFFFWMNSLITSKIIIVTNW